MSSDNEVVQNLKIFRTVEVPTQRMDWIIPQIETGMLVNIIWLKTWWKNLILYLRRKGFWISGKLNFKGLFCSFRTIKTLTQSSEKKFSFLFCSTNGTFPTEILLEKIEPVLTEKHEFEDRDKLKTLEFSGIFGILTFWTKKQHDWLFKRLLFYKVRAFDEDLGSTHSACK